jgi:hypothetical protein
MGAGMRSAARTPPSFLISTVGPWGNRPYSAASPPCVRVREKVRYHEMPPR